MWKLRILLARFIVLYRPEYLMTLTPDASGWHPGYELGPLRARLFGVRIPTLWAFESQIAAGMIKNPKKAA